MSATIEVSQRDLAATAPLVPGTKTARHASIVQILSRERIRSQAQLRKALAQRGISTTQATLSRDLVELRATKIRAPGGELIYSMPEAGAPGQVHADTLSEAEETDDSLRAHTTPRLARWCAELLVTACPLCRYNLVKNRSAENVSVLYFTELLAEALGVKEQCRAAV